MPDLMKALQELEKMMPKLKKLAKESYSDEEMMEEDMPMEEDMEMAPEEDEEDMDMELFMMEAEEDMPEENPKKKNKMEY